jgi:hypothetical protein
MSKRFTSGGVGRFSFDEANATLAAADAMLAGFVHPGRRMTVPEDPPLVVKLTQDLGDQMFDPGPKGIKYRVWNWAEVTIDQGSPRKKITNAENGRTAQKFGESPLGRAVQLGGTAIVGELVVLFRMMDAAGRPWFCFSGRPQVTGQSTLLSITSVTEVIPGMYRYNVQPVYLNSAGMTSQRIDMPAGIAWNAYEMSQMHGQATEFNNPPSRLRVVAPVDGPVVGVLASDPSIAEVVYAFEAPSPLEPECIGPVPGAFGNLLEGNL